MFSATGLYLSIEGVSLIENLSLDVQVGEVVALVGPNGAGKSTLVRAVTGDLPLSAGQMEFNGRSIEQWPAAERARHLAVLPQMSVLEFPFQAREVVELARIPHATGARQDRQIVEEVLTQLDAMYLADRLYPKLSGGEKQRIQLARVLAQIWQPAEHNRLLILDEPSSYFDLAHQQMLIRLVRHLATNGVGVLMVVHDLNMALTCADRTAVMKDGCLEAFGNTTEVITAELVARVFNVQARFIRDDASGRHFVGLAAELD